jgi:hypothetical protein
MRTIATRSLVVVSLAGALGLGAFALAGPNGGGKRPFGEVVSYDAATGALTVDLFGSDVDFSAPTAANLKVKVDRRGEGSANGSTADLVAGADVVKLLVRDGVVRLVRLRPQAPTPTPAPSGSPAPSPSG